MWFSFLNRVTMFYNTDLLTDMLNLAIFLILLIVAMISTVLLWRARKIKEKDGQMLDLTLASVRLHTAVFVNDKIMALRIINQFPELINSFHPDDGYTPFMRACLNGNTQLVKLMLNNGADITLKSRKGETPFYLAVFYHILNPLVKDATCIRTLYYSGSDVNETNAKGYSPLQLAVVFGHTHLVNWLLQKGAFSMSISNPYLLAQRQGHYRTALTLQTMCLKREI